MLHFARIIEKASVEEIIDVSKEMTEETLKEITDKALMGKLKEVDTEPVEPVSVSTESVQKESDEESESVEVKTEGVSELESDGVGNRVLKLIRKKRLSRRLIQFLKLHAKTVQNPAWSVLKRTQSFRN